MKSVPFEYLRPKLSAKHSPQSLHAHFFPLTAGSCDGIFAIGEGCVVELR